MDVVVVGLGGTGSAALRVLAEEGHRVVGLERFEAGHGRGSSHGESRIIRHAYEDAAYARLMLRAWPEWLDLERAAGEELLVPCGGLTLGPSQHPGVLAVEDSLRRVGAPHERLDARAASARFPALAMEDGEVAIFEERAGFLRATRCVLAQQRLARAAGADVREGAQVVEVHEQGDRAVALLADGSRLDADRVVIAAGAWTDALVPALATSLRVTWQQVLHLRARGDLSLVEPAHLPVWIDAASHDYGFPRDGVVDGCKVASHVLGPSVDPDVPHREPDLAAEAALVARARRRIPALTGEISHALACLYTNAPGEDFIVGFAPGSRRVVVVSGCSGHGFKFTALLGRLAADLALGRPLPPDCSRFSRLLEKRGRV